ncbi:MAG: hypothetical protein IPH06_10845 [Alphaproteobacteria bacterium]|nr:hypothetical protein [Alphaproteobacteria bacterium]QQS58479.1 MAG: hypothetical protein IPN28_06600 [Alphaproteobacteria bacterium]
MKKFLFLTKCFCTLLILSSNAQAKSNNEHILSCINPIGHHLYFEEYKCPVGGETFQALTLGVHSTYGMYLDLKPISYMDMSTPVPVCPSNGFVIFKENFSKEELDKIKIIIKSETYKKIFKEKNASNYLYYNLAKEIKDPDIDLWWVLLKATWEADSCGNRELYKKYAQETIEVAEKELTKAKKEDQNYWMLSLIIPELYRRTGDFEQAQIWAKKIDTSLMPESNYKDYMKLAYKLLKKSIKKKNLEPVPVEEK